MSRLGGRRATTAGLLLLGSGLAWGQMPQKINYQGRLFNGTVPVNGITNIEVRLYSAATNGTLRYTETNSNVVVSDGLYTFLIGDEASGLAAAVANSPVYLELVVGATTLTPREPLVAAPYALQAASVPYGTITSAMIQNGTISGEDIQDGTVYSADIQDGAVASVDIQNGTVASVDIQDGTVASVDLQNGAALAEIADNDGAGSGLDADLLDGQQAAAFAAEAHNHDNAYVNEGQANSVSSNMIVNASVTAADLHDGAALAEIADDDGTGSGLDADLLDGEHGDRYHVIISVTNSSTDTVLGPTLVTCTGSTITITAPRSGRIVVEASVFARLSHVFGTPDDLCLAIATTPSDVGTSMSDWIYMTVGAAYPTCSSLSYTLTGRRSFSVSAGSHTYYLNGRMDNGGLGDDKVIDVTMRAFFYPDT